MRLRFPSSVLALLILIAFNACNADGDSGSPCPEGHVLCDEECVDPDVDDDHCGTCYNQCRTFTGCVDGICVCSSEYASCTGECVDLLWDNRHCGRCNKACLDNQSCYYGICRDICVTDEDCPMSAFQCCVDRSCEDMDCRDLECGSDRICGKECGTCPSGTECDRGTCVIVCSDSLTNCDGECVDIKSDMGNCGGCANECTVQNGTPSCSNGSCKVDSCNSPYSDCDGAYENGCEVDLSLDQQGCNMCNDCPGAPGGHCADETCEVRCGNGYGDCNGVLRDGCETYLPNTSTSCGECNRDCLWTRCSESRCHAMILAEWAEGGEMYHIAVDAAHIYFTATITNMLTLETFGEVWQVAKDGSTSLALSGGEIPVPFDIAVDDTHVYWTNDGDGTVKKAEKNIYLGESDLATEQPWPTGIDVDDNYVYWVDLTDGVVRAVPKGGPACGGPGSPECIELGAGPAGARHLVVDTENIYWTIAGDDDGAVVKLSKQGGAIEFLAEGQANPHGIAVDSDNVYWVNRGTSEASYTNGTVVSIDKNGGSILIYDDEQNESIALAVDDTYVYWGERGLARILKAPKVGGPVSIAVNSPLRLDGGNVYAETGVFASDIAVDESAIFWTHRFGGLVLKIVK